MDLTVISPQGVVLHEQVNKVTLPGAIGSFTILNNHAPLIAALGKGAIRYGETGGEQEYAIEGGVVEVDDNRIRILINNPLLL